MQRLVDEAAALVRQLGQDLLLVAERELGVGEDGEVGGDGRGHQQLEEVAAGRQRQQGGADGRGVDAEQGLARDQRAPQVRLGHEGAGDQGRLAQGFRHAQSVVGKVRGEALRLSALGGFVLGRFGLLLVP